MSGVQALPMGVNVVPASWNEELYCSSQRPLEIRFERELRIERSIRISQRVVVARVAVGGRA